MEQEKGIQFSTPLITSYGSIGKLSYSLSLSFFTYKTGPIRPVPFGGESKKECDGVIFLSACPVFFFFFYVQLMQWHFAGDASGKERCCQCRR